MALHGKFMINSLDSCCIRIWGNPKDGVQGLGTGHVIDHSTDVRFKYSIVE
jgi:hypothetical protein